MKFIFTTDWHLRSIPPSSIKVDNFLETIYHRIETIFSKQVDFILHGGDLFDSHEIVDLNFFNEILLLFKKNSIPFYVVPGQHDLIGYSPNSLNWSSLKTLENAGCIHILPPGLCDINGLPIYTVYPSKNHNINYYKNLSKLVIITHNIVSPIKLVYDYVLTDDISKVIDHCLVLCGDLHMCFEKIYDNCAFLNPGPLLRLTKEEISKQGFFELYINLNDFSCSYKKYEFEDMKIQVEETIDINIFTDQLKTVSVSSNQSLEDIIRQTGLKLFNDGNVVEEAIKWIKLKKYWI